MGQGGLVEDRGLLHANDLEGACRAARAGPGEEVEFIVDDAQQQRVERVTTLPARLATRTMTRSRLPLCIAVSMVWTTLAIEWCGFASVFPIRSIPETGWFQP